MAYTVAALSHTLALALLLACVCTGEGFVLTNPLRCALSGRAALPLRGFTTPTRILGARADFMRGPHVEVMGKQDSRERSSTVCMIEAKTRKDAKKVAVIGSGAVGLYYGARLQEAGHDVSYFCRRDLEAIKQKGLTVDSVDGNMRFEPHEINVFGSTEEIGKVDWIVVALKSYSLKDAPDLIRPCMGPKTRILAIMNGYGIESTLAKSFPAESIFGGMAFICNNRGVPGVVYHQKYGALLVGHFQDKDDQLKQVRALFDGVNVKLSTSNSLLKSRWDKLCWNIPFNGIACAMGGITTDKIVGDPSLRELAYDVMREVVDAANEDLEETSVPKQYRIDKEEILERMFTLTDSMGVYKPSTMIDLVEGHPMEVEYMFSNPLGRAQELGVNVPHMQSIINMIKAHQRLRHL